MDIDEHKGEGQSPILLERAFDQYLFIVSFLKCVEHILQKSAVRRLFSCANLVPKSAEGDESNEE
jgi:hypothetical protein